jgi:gelsolin
LGSEADKKLRATTSQKEKAWKKVKGKVGLIAWRIEKFKVKHCPEAERGHFFNGDSYILLNTFKDPKNDNKLRHDLHFWLGETTSQDEMGTAAYKTVELDDYVNLNLKLGDPVQHRNCSGHESDLFLSYFADKGGMRIEEGGIDSGFNIVKPELFRIRLLHLKGKKRIRVVEKPIDVKSLNSGDVFILDCGMNLYQYQGKASGKKEKFRAGQLQREIDDERKGKPEVHTFRQGSSLCEDQIKFWSAFLPCNEKLNHENKDWTDATEDQCHELEKQVPEDEGGCDEAWEKKQKPTLMQLTVDDDDASKVEFKQVAKGKLKKNMLISDDAFIVDVGMEIFIWIGTGANQSERKLAMNYATKYLVDSKKR